MYRKYGVVWLTMAAGVLFAVKGTFAQEVDIMISDVRVIESGPAAGQLFTPVKDKSGQFGNWYDDQVQKRRDAGEDPAPESIYPYSYRLWIEEKNVAEGASYLPRSGQDWLQIPDFTLPDDGLEREIVMKIKPMAGLPDTDIENNVYKTILAFGKPVLSTVSITLTSLDVHDDCDNFSPGDWQILLGAYLGQPDSRGRLPGGRPTVFEFFPSPTSTRDFDSGETRSVGLSVDLQGVRPGETVNMYVSVLDCDSEIAPRLDTLPIGRECRGEEFPDSIAGGAHDLAGRLTVTLGPEQWPDATTLSSEVPFHRDHDCGDSVEIGAMHGRDYTANFSIDVREE